MPSQAGSPPSAPLTPPKPPPRIRCNVAGCRKLAKPGRKRCGGDHKPGATGPASRGPGRKPLIGTPTPRVYTRPLRPLNRKTTRGYEVIDFARMIGEPLLPWQEQAVIRAFELLPDGSYRFRTVLILVARQNGKSHLKRIVTLWRMYIDGAREIVGAAQDVSLARKQWNMCQATIHASPDLQEEWGVGEGAPPSGVRNVNGDEMFWAAGCVYAIKATNDKAGRGGTNDEVNIDELRTQHDWKAWASLSKTTSACPKGQVWAMSNAGDDTSVVLNQLQGVGEAGTDPSLCLLEWSAEPGCELDDPKAWCQANPGLGYTVSEAAIRSALGTDPPEIFRAEVLCQRVPNLDAAIDIARWATLADAVGSLEAYKGRIAACVDVAPDGRHATLALAAKTADGRARTEIHAAWNSTEAMRAELPALLEKIKPAAFGWYPSGPGAAVAVDLRPHALRWNRRAGGKRGEQEIPENGAIAGALAVECCMGLSDLVTGARVIHPADPLLDAHVGAASKLYSGDGWRFTRKGEGHVDAAYAAAGAVRIALTMPEPKRARIRVLVA